VLRKRLEAIEKRHGRKVGDEIRDALNQACKELGIASNKMA
jgi:hypothetical protein